MDITSDILALCRGLTLMGLIYIIWDYARKYETGFFHIIKDAYNGGNMPVTSRFVILFSTMILVILSLGMLSVIIAYFQAEFLKP